MVKPRKPGTTRTTRAKAGAKLKSDTPQKTEIEDAAVVEETTAEDNSEPVEGVKAESAEAAGETDAIVTGAADGEKPDAAETAPSGVDKDAPEEPRAPDGGDAPKDNGASSGPQDRSGGAAAAELLPQPVPPAPPERKSGFGGMVIGGVIAALLGAAALYYSNEQGWVSLGKNPELEAAVSAQAAQIASLQTALDAAAAEIATLAGTGAAIDAVNARINGVTEVLNGVSEATVTLGGKLQDTNDRLDTVATEPIPEARLPEKVTNAYEAKFAEFSAALQKQQDAKLAEIEAKLTATLTEMEALQSVAKAAEQAAMEAEANASVRAALADIGVALDTGSGYAPALAALSEAGRPDVPAALADGADGSIRTLGQLQASFPEAARAALVASTRAAADDGSVSGLTAFLRTQLGARSLEPRDGDDPDAVLSRAEAAVSNGDLQAALAEFDALPEAGQTALADWKARAEARLSATSALAALTDQLNSN